VESSHAVTPAASSTALVIVGVAVADLVTKAIVAGALPLHAAVPVDRAGWLILAHGANCGGAGGLIPRLPLVIIAAPLVVALVKALTEGDTAWAVIAGGAVGNVASVTLGPAGVVLSRPGLLGAPTGCAIDWLQVGAPVLGSQQGIGAPIFNLADVAIFTGALALSRGVPESPLGWAALAVLAVLGLVALGVVLHTVRIGLLGR